MVRAVLSVMLGSPVVRYLFMWPVVVAKSLLFKEMSILYQMGLLVLVFLSLVFWEGVGTFTADKWKEPLPPGKVSSLRSGPTVSTKAAGRMEAGASRLLPFAQRLLQTMILCGGFVCISGVIFKEETPALLITEPVFHSQNPTDWETRERFLGGGSSWTENL